MIQLSLSHYKYFTILYTAIGIVIQFYFSNFMKIFCCICSNIIYLLDFAKVVVDKDIEINIY